MNAKYFLGILLVFNIYWISLLYEPFLLTILIATLFSIATSTLYNKLSAVSKSEATGAFLSSTILALIFFAPLGYFIYEGVVFVKKIDTTKIELFIPSVQDILSLLPSYFDFLKSDIEKFLISVNLPQLARDSVKYILSIGGQSVIFFKDSLLIIIFYFFIQFYRNRLGRYFKRIIPLSTQDTVSVFKEISVVMGTVFYSIVFTAAFQGGLFSLIVYSYGYNPILFGILYGFSSLIPVIGGMLMWLPIMLYEFSLGNFANGIVIMLYSIIVIAFFADTIIKPMIIKYINTKIMNSRIYVNELLIFFSMIAGISSFGFWGVILGPAIISLFLSLIKLYEKLYKKDGNIFKLNLNYSEKK
jgi:predicted PurR-regulated permease PerM